MGISRTVDAVAASRAGAAVTVEGLAKHYGRFTAVENVSFSIRRGAVTGFFGPNGAGKTTVLKVISGIARASAGQVLLNGHEGPARDARVLGAFIESCGAHPGRSARIHLRSLATMAGLPRTRVPEVLASGASQERLLLARTIAYAITGLVVGTLMVAVSLGAGLPLLGRQPGPDLSAGEVTGVAVGLLGSSVLATMIGVAVGALLRNQILAAVGALILTFVVNPLLDRVREGASDYTPLGSVAVLTRMVHGPGRISLAAAAIVLGAWTVVLMAAALAGERRRDLA